MENYEEAALRHHCDAHHLANDGRYDNASHLIGFAVECALKLQLKIHGAASAKVHLPMLLNVYKAQLKGRTAQLPVAVNQLVDGPLSFSNWCVNDRYRKNKHVDKQLWEQQRLKAGKLFVALGMRKKS